LQIGEEDRQLRRFLSLSLHEERRKKILGDLRATPGPCAVT